MAARKNFDFPTHSCIPLPELAEESQHVRHKFDPQSRSTFGATTIHMETEIISIPTYRVWSREKVLYGPYELPALVTCIRQKRLPAETWIFSEHNGNWNKASDLAELKPLFDSAHAKPGHIASAMSGGVHPDILLRIKVLAGLKQDQLQSFVSYMEILSLEPLATAVKEHDRGDAMFLILEGEVRVRVMRDGKESILATLKSGDFFGEVSLLDEGPRSADVVRSEEHV